MKHPTPLILAALMLGTPPGVRALESAAVELPGIRSVRLVTDHLAIAPGERFTVALDLDPLPEHHTYWKGPGIVGVATRVDWTLPTGFEAGEMLWPVPQVVLMAGIEANGYRGRRLLLTEITAPSVIERGEVTLRARCSWMSCSVSCNPGNADLSLTIPVAADGSRPAVDPEIAKRFDAVRLTLPAAAPDSWTFHPRLPAPDRIELDLKIPGLSPPVAQSLHFFCHDMQVDSDETQQVEVIDAAAGSYRLVLARPDFAPRNPPTLSGVLRVQPGWPGLESEHIEIAPAWPEGTFTP
jgi:DsbC/DsbD-like thiol-disulfide interchange protein